MNGIDGFSNENDIRMANQNLKFREREKMVMMIMKKLKQTHEI